jgi:Ankyrin repeats (3 copies)
MKNRKALPPLFWYMEIGDWEKATDRAQRHPREVKTWTTLRTKSMADAKVSSTKRLALHHACFKLRSVVPNARMASTSEDSFVEVCKFIMLLISLYPEAAGVRESRHGCLPLHLAAFASCSPRANDLGVPSSTSPIATPVRSPSAGIPRPHALSQRTASESTTGSGHTNMTEIFMQENFAGSQTAEMEFSQRRDGSISSPIQPSIGVSMHSSVLISVKRENMAVKVINALLDAYPKAIRVDSEGGRLPLHTACAGRASPRVITTLLTAYPAAARHRNKDGFLPLHLAAHWGVSHPNVAIALLKSYPDSTMGRNRWERTPLEEALCMAGENGRPHQAALVCALRKHPSYWTRPLDEVLRSEFVSERTEGPTSVDIDDSLPDDDTLDDGEEVLHDAAGYPLL